MKGGPTKTTALSPQTNLRRLSRKRPFQQPLREMLAMPTWPSRDATRSHRKREGILERCWTDGLARGPGDAARWLHVSGRQIPEARGRDGGTHYFYFSPLIAHYTFPLPLHTTPVFISPPLLRFLLTSSPPTNVSTFFLILFLSESIHISPHLHGSKQDLGEEGKGKG